jgi:hypothetical protein
VAIREKLRAGFAQYLRSGEEIQAVFMAKRPTVQYNDRAVVATNQRLCLLKLNFLAKPTERLVETSRETRLGPWTGKVMYRLPAFDGSLSVHRRFRKDVDEADRAAGLQSTSG